MVGICCVDVGTSLCPHTAAALTQDTEPGLAQGVGINLHPGDEWSGPGSGTGPSADVQTWPV